MFDLGRPHIDKFWWAFLLKTLLKGDVTFEVSIETDTQLIRNINQQTIDVPLFLFTDGTEIYYWTDGSEIYMNSSTATGAARDMIFLNNTAGSYAVYEIREKTASIFDLYGMQIKGIIGKVKF